MTEPYYTDGRVTLYHGDCIEVLGTLPDASVDAIVTDPPYALGFMGRGWDTFGDVGRGAQARVQRASEVTATGVGHQTSAGPYLASGVDSLRSAGEPFQRWCEAWSRECLRVLKPGGHMLAFGGTRTWHRLACAVEDAGFEVRDSIAWLYASGFPKSHNLTDEDGARTGWGTALKPAFEPVVVARKPLAGTVAANVERHGTGALNIDATRIDASGRPHIVGTGDLDPVSCYGNGIHGSRRIGKTDFGRWPANVVLDPDMATELDHQSGDSTSRAGSPRGAESGEGWGMTSTGSEYPDSGGASRFFYVAKADAAERPKIDGTAHPTVKPLTLMRWLVRLVTPPGGTVLEPFAGSGTTVEACLLEGFQCVAIEREDTYLPLILQRIHRQCRPVEALRQRGDDLGLFDFGEGA